MSNLLPIGRYPAKAVDALLEEANSGSLQIHIRFELLEPPDGWRGPLYRSWWGTLNGGKAEDIALEAMRAAGWQGSDITDLSTIGSCECAVVVVHEPGQDGVERAKIAWVNSAGSGPGINHEKAASPAKVQDIRARIAAKAAAKLQGQPPANNTGRPKAPPLQATGTDGVPYTPTGEDDDDIPF